MAVARNKEPHITIDGFSGGVNEFSDPTHISPGELAACSNMDVRDGRTLSSRWGQSGEHDRDYQLFNKGCKRLFRYRSLAGDRRLVAMMGDDMYVDLNESRQFDKIASFNGTSTFQQFYDTVLLSSDEKELSVYDPSTGTITTPYMGASLYGDLTGTPTTTDGRLLDGYYYYRFTFDIEVGGVFLGETAAATYLVNIAGIGPRNYYNYVTYDYSASGTNTNIGKIERPSDLYVDAIPSYVARINIYRSPALTAEIANYETYEDYSLFWVGAVDMATVRAAASGDVIFTDDGTVPLGKQIRKNPNYRMPRSASMVMHKGRLWLGSPALRGNDESDWTYWPDLVAFSQLEANGAEPCVFFPESNFAVGAGEPEPITLVSFRNQILLAFKPNKIFAIYGGDSELDFGQPNIEVRLLDPNVGCVAPDTIQFVDGGVAWLSNRGPYIYDGTAPRPLRAERVKKTFKKMVASAKKRATGVYDSREREYTIFFTGSASPYNREYMRFNFYTGAWTTGTLKRGVGATLDIREDDKEGYVLWGIDDSPLATFASCPFVMRADNGNTEGFDPNVSHTEYISFSADLGFLDGGEPWMDKRWKEILVEATSQVPLTLDLLIDNKYDSRLEGTSLTLTPPVSDDTLVWGVGTWGTSKWGLPNQGTTRRVLTRSLDTLPIGKSIRPIFSGENYFEPVKIHSVTIFFEPEEQRS